MTWTSYPKTIKSILVRREPFMYKLPLSLSINSSPFLYITKIKYFGDYFDNYISRKHSIKHIINNFRKAIYALNSILHSSIVSYNSKTLLCKTVLLLVLLCTGSMWSYACKIKNDVFQSTQNKILRVIPVPWLLEQSLNRLMLYIPTSVILLSLPKSLLEELKKDQSHNL